MSATRDSEFPDPERLRIYGDLAFLAMRSTHHRAMPVSVLRAALEPPILLGQYKIFRFDGVPRGALTWAWLSDEAEARYLDGEGFRFEDWRSGETLWIIDFLAPYRGLAAGMVRWVMRDGSMPQRQFRFRRVTGGRHTRRVVHIDLDRHDNGSVAKVV